MRKFVGSNKLCLLDLKALDTILMTEVINTVNETRLKLKIPEEICKVKTILLNMIQETWFEC